MPALASTSSSVPVHVLKRQPVSVELIENGVRKGWLTDDLSANVRIGSGFLARFEPRPADSFPS